MNEALNVGKHFISASSIFIRQDQPLAWTERSSAHGTAEGKAQVCMSFSFFRQISCLNAKVDLKLMTLAVILKSERIWG